MFYQGPHWANQISISVDELPKVVDDNTLQQRDHMAGFIASVLTTMLVDEREIKPQVHLTLRSPETLESYCGAGVPFFLWSEVDLISFSEIYTMHPDLFMTLRGRQIQKLQETGVQINYNALNKMIPEGLPIDSIYLLVKKLGTGQEFYFLPPQYKKVYTDICLHHLQDNNCNANISKFQVWPDGSVSGCPYQQKSDTPEALTAEEVVGNIISSARERNFERCCLK
jgi:hypothetical protein